MRQASNGQRWPDDNDTAHDDGAGTTTDGENHGSTDEATTTHAGTPSKQHRKAGKTRDCVFISIDRKRGEGRSTATV